MVHRKIEYFKDKNNACPTQSFIDSLPHKAKSKVFCIFELVEELPKLSSNLFKKLKNTELWEIRVNFDKKAYRFFCFFHEGNLLIITHGIIKKSQKTPAKEIKRAQELRKDFLKDRGIV